MNIKIGNQIDQRFTVLNLLGTGGQGKVFLVEDNLNNNKGT